jgi:myosin heavy subunit
MAAPAGACRCSFVRLVVHVGAQVVRDEAVENACAMLGLEPDALVKALTHKRIVTPSEVITKVGKRTGGVCVCVCVCV